MGGFMGVGGSSAKTDRGTELKGFGDLANIFNFALPQAKTGAATGAATTAAGTGALGDSLDYWKKLMSGNRATMEQAVAPQTNAVQSQADAAKRNQAASGTARGGGTAGVNQQTNDKAMAQIDNMLFGAQTEGAEETAKVGGQLAQTGVAESAIANQTLSIGSQAAQNLTADAGASRMDSYKINKDTQQSIQNEIMSIASLFA